MFEEMSNRNGLLVIWAMSVLASLAIPAWAQQSPEMTDGDRADQLVRLGMEAIDQGSYDEAETYFGDALELVPGHPEAVDGLEQLQLHRRVEMPSQSQSDSIRLIDRIRQKRAILWQRAVATYRQAERKVHEFLTQNQFELARRQLLLARETLEAARPYAEPIEKYSSLRNEYEALADMVHASEREYSEQRAFELRREVEAREEARLESILAERHRQVTLLMEQVEQKREDRDFDGAVQVLRQVLVIDPQNPEAEWLMEELQDIANIRKQVDARANLERETRDLLIQAEEAKVPWHEEINYPDNWLDVLRSPYRRVPGAFPGAGYGEDAEFEQSFQSRLPEFSLNETPLGAALEQIAERGDINIVPNWGDLASVDIDYETPVTLKLKDVTLKNALEETLDQVTGGRSYALGYSVEDGIVKVASQDYLDRDVYTLVYPVQDLVHPVHNYDDGPRFGLDHHNKRSKVRTDLRRSVFDSEDPGSRTNEFADSELTALDNRELADLVGLIRRHVRAGSWRSGGGAHAMIHARRDGNLVVTQTALGHREIFNLLNQLREDNKVQIAIEARFLTVNHNFLEDMGIDLDIVLNNGNAGFDRTGLVDPSGGGELLLPRGFSRVGFAPSVATFGTTLDGGQTPPQAYLHPAMVPGVDGSSNNLTPLPVANNASTYTNTSNLSSDISGSFAGGNLPPALSIAGSFLDNIQVDFLIRATQADQRTSTLTAPKLVLTNGQQAWIAITNEQNYVSSAEPQVQAGAAATEPDVATLSTGAVLNVQATSSPDRRYVTMNLEPGVGRLVDITTFQYSGSPVTGNVPTGFLQLPIIQRQQVKTTVTVPNGGTLLVGGQKLTFENEVEAGVPILSKLPILKRLYSSRSKVSDEQVLLILIKPEILIKEEQEERAFPSLGSLN